MIDPKDKKEVDLESLDKQIKGYVAFLGENKKYEEYKKSIEGKSQEEQKKLAQEMLDSFVKKANSLVSEITTSKMSSQAEVRRAEVNAKRHNKAGEYNENKEAIQEAIQFSEGILELLGDVNYTKGKLSKEDLIQKRDRNKSRIDPNNEYPQYSGYPYTWGVKINNNIENFGIIDENNILGERVVVTNLGDYYYTAVMYGPNEKHRAGSGFDYHANMIGVTKLDVDGNELSSDVLLAQLTPESVQQDRERFINVQLSQELIEHANCINNGYIGKFVHRRFSAQELELSQEEIKERLSDGMPIDDIDLAYIAYNGPGTSELVSALELAKFETGTVLKDGKVKHISNFEDLKKGLLKIQRAYIEACNAEKQPKNDISVDFVNTANQVEEDNGIEVG